jgi:hypothetical protein
LVKQSAQQHQEDQSPEINRLTGEKIGVDLLLCGWNKTLEAVNEAVQHNLRSGVKDPERFVSFLDTTPMDIKKKKNWLASCINNKTGTPYTLDSLIAAQIISEEERQLFGELPLPRRELVSMYRVQSPDKSEHLVRGEIWYGLNKSAGIVSITTPDLDYGRRISVTREFVDMGGTKSGEQTLVKIIGDSKEWYTADKVYLTPFSEAVVKQALKNAGPPVTQKDLHGKISLGLIREGVTNPRGIKDKDNDLDAFTNGNFDELFEQSSRPATGNTTTNINVDPRQLEAFLKYQQEHKQDDQYQ